MSVCYCMTLTMTSPLHSYRQCMASSWLVPPPHNALEHARCMRSSTAGTHRRSRKDTDLNIWSCRFHLNKAKLQNIFQQLPFIQFNELKKEKLMWYCVSYKPLCCCSVLASRSGSGAHTRSALCRSCCAAERSLSSGTSAWYRNPMFIRLQVRVNINRLL